MSLELEGIVKQIGDIQSFNDGAFTKKEFLLTIDESSKYPQDIPIEVINKNTGLLDAIGVGDKVRVDINLRGSEYNGRNYVSINAWRMTVSVKSGTPAAPVADTARDAAAADTTLPPVADDGDDDLPF